MVDGMEDKDLCTKPLGRCSVFYYGVGHMLNDITSACWFTYLLVFLTDIGLSPRDSAAVMLSGQVADAFTTIFAGELIDRFGHFKIWHGAGSVLVAFSFSSVFGGCLPCKILGHNSTKLQTIGYSVFAAIFNIGWAATQVSHMSMVNCITANSTSRVVLTSCRNAFTMVANLSLYAVALLIFSVSPSRTIVAVENQYRWIAYSSIFIGCCFVGIFHLGTNEPRLNQGDRKSYARISWTYWFKKVLYYQVALVYVVTRLVTNVSQVCSISISCLLMLLYFSFQLVTNVSQAFLAFYVINDLRMPQSSKALVPVIIYISSFIVSILLQEITWAVQHLKAIFTAGGVVWIFCGTTILFLPRSLNYYMYILSIVIGMANALMMVAGVSMQSVLVGENLNSCAFVYGTLSFLDKMSCGIALCILQSFQKSVNTFPNLQECNPLYFCFSVTRYGLGLVPAISALVGVVVTCTMKLHPSALNPLADPLLAES